MLLDYLSCFAVVLRGIHGKVDICQTDYSIFQTKKFPVLKSYIEIQQQRLTEVKEK